MASFDLIVIGAGMAGINAAARAVEAEARVAVIERERVGGTCRPRGCIPARRSSAAPRSPTRPAPRCGAASAYHAADLIHPVVVAMRAGDPDALVGAYHVHSTLGETVQGAVRSAFAS